MTKGFQRSALLALLLASTALTAQAAPARAHRISREQATITRQQQEIDALKAQLQSVVQRLDAQDAAHAETKAQTAAVQAQVQATAARTQAVEARETAQAQALPAEVKKAVAAATPAPKKVWPDDTTVGALVFADISSINQHANNARVAPSGVGMDLKRAYLIIDHRFDKVLSANLTTDAQYSSSLSATELFVKKAYLQARFSDALVVSAGANSLPWAPFVENLYGARYVEKVLVDRTGFGTTTDWGVHTGGSLADGLISYQVSVIDGAGFKAPLRSRGMDVEGRISATKDGFTVGLGGYSGKLGKEIQGVHAYHTATRFNAVAAYVQPDYRLGVEYFQSSDWTSVTTAAADKAEGYSVFGTVRLSGPLTAFGRYDWVKPNKTSAPAKEDSYYNIGLGYALAKTIDLALVFKTEDVEGGTYSASNGAIGSTTGAKTGRYNELGVWTQFKY